MSLKNDKVGATTNVAGIAVQDTELADWLFKSVQYCTEQAAGHKESIECIYEKIRQMLIVHYCLLGADKEAAESAANDYINFINVLK